MTLLHMTLKSLKNRRTTTLLTLLSIVISTTLLLSIEKIRLATKESFEGTLSQTDLIVGARTSPLQILLYSVFRIGDATNNIRYSTFEHFAHKEEVKFAIPISLGDSHKGFRVIGTDLTYFEFYKYRGGKGLEFLEGQPFQNIFEVVIGADVAQKLHYGIGSQIVLSHGTGEVSFQDHASTPFKIVGILKKTFTPVDQSVHVSLPAIEAIHVGWEDGAPPQAAPTEADLLKKNLNPTQITAMLIGLKSRIEVFKLKREIDQYPEEPLIGVLPGVVFTDLWRTLGFVENVLKILSLIVFLSSLLSLVLVLLSSLNERRREMAILRSMGAQPKYIFKLLFIESSLLTVSGLFLGIVLSSALTILTNPLIEKTFGLTLRSQFITYNELQILLYMLVLGLLVGVIPARSAYKKSVSDGLTVKT